MFSYFTSRRAGNAIVGVDFDWTGACAFPGECTIHFVLWKLVGIGTEELQWVKVGSDDVVSLTGITLLSGPHYASGSFSTYKARQQLFLLSRFIC